ncbi:MAG: hypothetical protein PHX13_00925 [Thiovulaceae bacterium]|nr:hypothetical protein [Sulfurimonadaceae bacterium]
MKKIFAIMMIVMVMSGAAFAGEKAKNKEVTICVEMGVYDENDNNLLCGINNRNGIYKSTSLVALYKDGWQYVGRYVVTSRVYNGQNAFILER